MLEPIQRLIDTIQGTAIDYISGEYVGSTKTRCTFKCKDGHTFERLWRTVVVGRIFKCPICTGVRFNNQKVDESLKPLGYERVGEYINAQKEFSVKCPKGHITNIRWSNFSRGHRCKICSDTKHSDVSIDQDLQKYGYHRCGEYLGVFERLRMTCPVGHKIDMAYNDFRKGGRCGQCYLESKNDYHKAKEYACSLGYIFIEENKSKVKIAIRCPVGHVYNSTWGKFLNGTRCNVCSSSYWEQDFHVFLKSLNVNYRYNVRDLINGEIDFVIGNTGIELNGSYFHSEKYVPKKYHFNKHVACQEKGIRLIQIFDHEWQNKPDVYRYYIKAKLGIFDHRIFARDCVIDTESPKSEVREFINDNHLQGYSGHLESYALRHGGQIVACITISRHHRKSDELILNRLCTRVGYKIEGGFERLMNCIPMKAGLVTHADLRFTDGAIYRRLGFSEDGFLRPDYYYIKNGIKVSKQSMKKMANEKLLGLSEKDLRSLQGYLRVYDAGKIRFRWTKGLDQKT